MDEDAYDDAGAAPEEDAGEAEYGFEGYRVVFSRRAALTPPPIAGQAGR
jgi:hypothetical protein